MSARDLGFFVALVAASLLTGCGPDDPIPGGCGPGELHGAVVTKLGFTRIAGEGVAPGFNLDDLVSDGTDYVSCGQIDYIGPDGTVGVDNQLAKLVPDVEAIVGNAVDGLLQGSINDGQLVILMELHGVNDFVNDECVEVGFQVGKKRPPSLGTDAEIESYQTFNPDPAAELSHTSDARIVDGALMTGPFSLAIPLAIFDVAFTIHIQDARIKLTIDEEGKMAGFLGGGVIPNEILEGLKDGAGLSDILPLVKLALDSSTDLKLSDETGKCEQLSSTLAISAAPAFVRR